MSFCFFHEERISTETCAFCTRDLCSDCQTVVKGKIVCPKCLSFANQQTQPVEIKNPFMAALFSFFLPGAGQIYNGQIVKGLVVFLTFWMILPWLYGIYDAFDTAKRINRGERVIVFPFHGWRIGLVIVAMLIGLPVLVRALYLQYARINKIDLKEISIEKNLRAVSDAAEEFYEENQRYPRSLSEMQFSSRLSEDSRLCNEETDSYVVRCNFFQGGYEIIAEPISSESKLTLKVATGGIFYKF